jgi:hypothetical protein
MWVGERGGGGGEGKVTNVELCIRAARLWARRASPHRSGCWAACLLWGEAEHGRLAGLPAPAAAERLASMVAVAAMWPKREPLREGDRAVRTRRPLCSVRPRLALLLALPVLPGFSACLDVALLAAAPTLATVLPGLVGM